MDHPKDHFLVWFVCMCCLYRGSMIRIPPGNRQQKKTHWTPRCCYLNRIQDAWPKALEIVWRRPVEPGLGVRCSKILDGCYGTVLVRYNWNWLEILHVGVSKNSGTPKSSILIGFSIINHPFWGTPIFGNTHVLIRKMQYIFEAPYFCCRCPMVLGAGSEGFVLVGSGFDCKEIHLKILFAWSVNACVSCTTKCGRVPSRKDCMAVSWHITSE